MKTRKGRNSIKPDWFPAPIHVDPPVTHRDWGRAIAIRLFILNADQDNDWKIIRYLKRAIFDPGTTAGPPDDMEWMSVKNLTAYESLMLGEICSRAKELGEVKQLVLRDLAEKPKGSDNESELRRIPVDHEILNEATGGHFFELFGYQQLVSVDLSQDDESVIASFKFWLHMSREMIASLGGKFINKPIDFATLFHWNNYKVLAAFDLLTWRKLFGAEYTDSAIAAWLWPDASDDYVDRAERFRKVTKPLMEQIFSGNTVSQLVKQWSWVAFLDNHPEYLQS